MFFQISMSKTGDTRVATNLPSMLSAKELTLLQQHNGWFAGSLPLLEGRQTLSGTFSKQVVLLSINQNNNISGDAFASPCKAKFFGGCCFN